MRSGDHAPPTRPDGGWSEPVRKVARRLIERHEALGLEGETDLPPVTDKGAYLHALCPVSDHGVDGEGDREAYSFTVRQGEDGRALINCFAGCSKERVLEELDLGWRDLFSQDGAEPNRLEKHPDPEILRGDEILAEGPPEQIEPLIPRFIWRRRLTIKAGREKTGKSSLVSYLVARYTVGGRVLGV